MSKSNNVIQIAPSNMQANLSVPQLNGILSSGTPFYLVNAKSVPAMLLTTSPSSLGAYELQSKCSLDRKLLIPIGTTHRSPDCRPSCSSDQQRHLVQRSDVDLRNISNASILHSRQHLRRQLYPQTPIISPIFSNPTPRETPFP